MKTRLIPIFLFITFVLVSCSTSSTVDNPAADSRPSGDAIQIAVILPIVPEGPDFTADDVMIGINRIAQEFGGTIYGRKETVDFGDKLEFRILETSLWVGNESVGVIADELRELDLESFDLVIGSGFSYGAPFIEIHEEYPNQEFIAIDNSFDLPGDSNLTGLQLTVYDAAFIAGAMAVERFQGQPLGAVGGVDLEFMHRDFFDGFFAGISYMDEILGTRTDVSFEFVGSFGDYQRGYEIADAMYADGVQCIYQAAGTSGWGVIDAALVNKRWVIGVDTDQGLEVSLRGEPSSHILTSTQKKWGNGVYLICKEYLSTGNLPHGTQVVGLAEDCADLAINPYNTPILGDQLETIRELKTALIAGELPSSRTESNVWKAADVNSAVEIITVSVNDPVLSPGIPSHYGPMIQEAMSTEFLQVGLYRVIDSEQVDRLLSEISFSLDGISEENTGLEVGRLVSAEAIVFVNLGEIGGKVNVDCKLVDVETGLMIGAARETYSDYESVLDGLGSLVAELGR